MRGWHVEASDTLPRGERSVEARAGEILRSLARIARPAWQFRNHLAHPKLPNGKQEGPDRRHSLLGRPRQAHRLTVQAVCRVPPSFQLREERDAGPSHASCERKIGTEGPQIFGGFRGQKGHEQFRQGPVLSRLKRVAV